MPPPSDFYGDERRRRRGVLPDVQRGRGARVALGRGQRVPWQLGWGLVWASVYAAPLALVIFVARQLLVKS